MEEAKAACVREIGESALFSTADPRSATCRPFVQTQQQKQEHMPSVAPSVIGLKTLIESQRVTAAIYVAAKLDISEHLRDGPMAVEELAKATATDAQALRRLLVALTTIGICAVAGENRYSITELGSGLDSQSERSQKAWAIYEGQVLMDGWKGLLDTIKTGKTRAELLGVSDSFTLMAQRPEVVGIFNAAMAGLTRVFTPDILAAIDFAQSNHLMDVGGGSGQLLAAIAAQYPHLRGTVYDLPRCAEAANEYLARMRVGERVSFAPGDFFETVPSGADAIIMKSIIHDWNDERSMVILKNCHAALPRDGRLVIVDRVMPDHPVVSEEHRELAMSDLNMLRGPGGLERSAKQYRDLLQGVGFRHMTVREAGVFNVIEVRSA
jgi:SAM-dependent methyltransferase